MANPIPEIHRVAIVTHPQIPESVAVAEQIRAYLEGSGLEAYHTLLQDETLEAQVKQGLIDLVIALGGDGTMLRAGHLCAPGKVPILGVNFGRFGFMIEVQQEQWLDLMPRLLHGEYWLEKRMMLFAELFHDGRQVGQWDVLNEVVVGRGKEIHPVQLVTYLDHQFLTTYVADSLIAATATGSTAYALAVGGPILPPELRNILLIAVAPHLSIDRAIVLAEGSSVSIIVRTRRDAILCADGQAPVELADGDQVNVHVSQHNALFVRFADPGYFYRNLIPHMSRNPSLGTPQ